MALTERPYPVVVAKTFLSILDQLESNQPAPALTAALPVYVLGLRNLAKGIVTRGARPAGWQCFSVGPGGLISGDVTDPGPNQAPPAASRSRGPAVDKVWAAYEGLKKLDIDLVRSMQTHYEPQALRIPGLHIEALWLRKKPFSEQLDQDFVVPFHTFNKALAAKLLFPMPDFLKIVRPLAAQQLKVDHPGD